MIEDMTKEQLTEKLEEMRKRISELELTDTKRKRAEERLRESEERFKQVAQSAGEWIWEVNADGLYTYSSPVVEKILGYKPEEIVGKKHFYDFFAPDVREELKKAAFDVFSTKEPFNNFFNPNIHNNGNRVILETSGLPILDENGNLVGYRGADTDVTKRKQVEAALIESEEKYRLLVDNFDGSITLYDSDGCLQLINITGAENLGGTPKEFLGKSLYELYPDKAAVLMERNRQVIESGRGGDFEDVFDLPSGKRWFLSNLQPVKDASGKAHAVQIVSYDITDFVKALKSNIRAEQVHEPTVP